MAAPQVWVESGEVNFDLLPVGALAATGERVDSHIRKELVQNWKSQSRRTRGTSFTKSKYMNPSFSERLPWIGGLAPRGFKSLCDVPDIGNARVIDVAQNRDSSNCLKCDDAGSVLPCLAKHVKLWGRLRNREWTGVELCASQGILLLREECELYSDVFLKSMAGNAFNRPTVLIIFLLLILVTARPDRPKEIDDEIQAANTSAAPSPSQSVPPPSQSVLQHVGNSEDHVVDAETQQVDDDMLAFCFWNSKLFSRPSHIPLHRFYSICCRM